MGVGFLAGDRRPIPENSVRLVNALDFGIADDQAGIQHGNQADTVLRPREGRSASHKGYALCNAVFPLGRIRACRRCDLLRL